MTREVNLTVICNPDGKLATYGGCNPFLEGVRYIIIRRRGDIPHVSGVYFRRPPHTDSQEVLSLHDAMNMYRFKELRRP